MIAGLWGRKKGMTQIFSGDAVVPVTVIDTGNWLVTAIKTEERDGYHALQLGHINKKYTDKAFSPMWVRKPKEYFTILKEVRFAKPVDGFVIGRSIDLEKALSAGDAVDAFGTTKGLGFAGVMRRHNFTGGRGSHGDKTGRKPGSVGSFCAEGKVMKGKRLPGRMGGKRHAVANLEIVKVDSENNIALIKGAVPGKAGSFVFLRKRG